jgi:hypothetical protein
MTYEKPIKTFVLFVALSALASCGSDSTDSGNGFVTLSTTENAAVNADVVGGITEVQTALAAAQAGSGVPTALHVLPTIAGSFSQTWPINGTHPCALGGHITYTGNIAARASWNDETGAITSSYIGGLVSFAYSDATNNLNDCQVAADVFLNGTLSLMVSGDITGASVSLVGSLEIDKRGPTGGLIPRGSCLINLQFPKGGTRVTGSVCGTAV